MMEQDSPQIFLSYANPDQARVIPFYEALEGNGFNVWLDCRKLKPGQNWDFEIKRALDKSSLVIAFLSNNSINRRGYVQRELKSALDKHTEKLIDDIYIIPVLLDEDTPIPDQLKGIQYIAASDPQCLEQVSDALTYQLGRLGIEVQKTQRKEEFSWISRTKKESWDGLPGYEVELQLLEFKSERYVSISEIGDFIKGDLLKSLFENRAVKLRQMPDLFNYGQDKFRRTNTYDAYCREPVIKEKVVTVQYAIHSYGAGAAHPNTHFQTYSFIVEPLIYISSLEEIFANSDGALKAIQESARQQLNSVRFPDATEGEEYGLDPKWVDSGTQDWSDFSSFVFGPEHLEILFAPYHVSAYACGVQFSDIPYNILVEFMKPEYISALQIEHLHSD